MYALLTEFMTNLMSFLKAAARGPRKLAHRPVYIHNREHFYRRER